MAAPLKIILTVGGIFLAGAVTGGFVGFRVATHYAREKPLQLRGGPLELIGGRQAEQLNLSPEQKQQLRPILGRAGEAMREMRREIFTRSTELTAKMDAELAKILTPEQCEQLREIRTQEEEHRRKSMIERAKHGEGREGRPNENPGAKRPRPQDSPDQ